MEPSYKLASAFSKEATIRSEAQNIEENVRENLHIFPSDFRHVAARLFARPFTRIYTLSNGSETTDFFAVHAQRQQYAANGKDLFGENPASAPLVWRDVLASKLTSKQIRERALLLEKLLWRKYGSDIADFAVAYAEESYDLEYQNDVFDEATAFLGDYELFDFYGDKVEPSDMLGAGENYALWQKEAGEGPDFIVTPFGETPNRVGFYAPNPTIGDPYFFSAGAAEAWRKANYKM